MLSWGIRLGSADPTWKIVLGIAAALLGAFADSLPAVTLYALLGIGWLLLLAIAPSSGRSHLALAGLLIAVVLYRLLLFRYYDDVGSSLHYEYVRRVLLSTLPIVDYPDPRPIYEAQPTSYLLLHYLSTLGGIDPVLAAKLLRPLFGVMNVLLVFSLARQAGARPTAALLAAFIFATSFQELWDASAVQFKQFTGQTFWYMGLLLLLMAVSNRSRRAYVAAALAFGIAGLGHKLFLFLIPLLVVPALLVVSLVPLTTRRLWLSLAKLSLPLLLVSIVVYSAAAWPLIWQQLGFSAFSASFVGAIIPDRLVLITDRIWLGLALSMAIGLLTLFAFLLVAHKHRRANLPRPLWLVFGVYWGGYLMVLGYLFGPPLDVGRLSSIIWPLACVVLAIALDQLLSQVSSRNLVLGTLLIIWAVVNLLKVALNPEQTGSVPDAFFQPFPASCRAYGRVALQRAKVEVRATAPGMLATA